jgi:hypothetical protein
LEQVLAATIADFHGASANTYAYTDNWATKTSKEMIKFKGKVGEKKFEEANEKYNDKIRNMLKSDSYKKADNEKKADMLDKEKARAKREVFRSYGFAP